MFAAVTEFYVLQLDNAATWFSRLAACSSKNLPKESEPVREGFIKMIRACVKAGKTWESVGLKVRGRRGLLAPDAPKEQRDLDLAELMMPTPPSIMKGSIWCKLWLIEFQKDVDKLGINRNAPSTEEGSWSNIKNSADFKNKLGRMTTSILCRTFKCESERELRDEFVTDAGKSKWMAVFSIIPNQSDPVDVDVVRGDIWKEDQTLLVLIEDLLDKHMGDARLDFANRIASSPEYWTPMPEDVFEYPGLMSSQKYFYPDSVPRHSMALQFDAKD